MTTAEKLSCVLLGWCRPSHAYEKTFKRCETFSDGLRYCGDVPRFHDYSLNDWRTIRRMEDAIAAKGWLVIYGTHLLKILYDDDSMISTMEIAQALPIAPEAKLILASVLSGRRASTSHCVAAALLTIDQLGPDA